MNPVSTMSDRSSLLTIIRSMEPMSPFRVWEVKLRKQI